MEHQKKKKKKKKLIKKKKKKKKNLISNKIADRIMRFSKNLQQNKLID